VQAYGEVDELNAAIGLAAALDPSSWDRDRLEAIQRDLFTIGAELATPDPAKVQTPHIDAARVRALEEGIDGHEASLPPLKNFILPGGSPKAAAFHLARTVCRRAERTVVELARDQRVNPEIVKYLNRLSDLLFVLARAVNKSGGRGDTPW
jgi:cob(I)alamin adenosyltransferase